MSGTGKASSGFGVFELFVALALLALIAGTMSASLGLGLQLDRRSQDAEAGLDPIAARLQLRRWIAGTVPPSRITPLKGFEGGPTSMSFITSTPTPFAPDAFALAVTAEVMEDRLVLTATPLGRQGTELSSTRRVLAGSATQVSFAFGSTNEGQIEWTTDWSDENRLPDLVRIEMDEGSEPEWPLFAAPLVLR